MEEKDSKKSLANVARYSGIGFQLLAIIGLFTWAGTLADHYFNHQTPWLTALLSLTGVCLGLFAVLMQLKD